MRPLQSAAVWGQSVSYKLEASAEGEKSEARFRRLRRYCYPRRQAPEAGHQKKR